MPNVRGKNQKLINIPVDTEFLLQMDAELKKKGYDNRSRFIRDAICEKLGIPSALAESPPRYGKPDKVVAGGAQTQKVSYLKTKKTKVKRAKQN